MKNKISDDKLSYDLVSIDISKTFAMSTLTKFLKI